MDDPENQLKIMARVRHPLSTMLRYSMIADMKLYLHRHIHNLYAGTVSTLWVKGGASLPGTHLRPGDLDIVIRKRPHNYNRNNQISALKDMFSHYAKSHSIDLYPGIVKKSETSLNEDFVFHPQMVKHFDTVDHRPPLCFGFGADGRPLSQQERNTLPGLRNLSPLEEVPRKLLAMLTSSKRAFVAERRAKDLLDVYIRTMQYPYDPSEYIDHIRTSLPANSAFNGKPLEEILNFSPLNADVHRNVKEVARGLLRLQKQGMIGEAMFHKPLTQDNAQTYATLLLEREWSIVKECFGLKVGGSQSHPTYEIDPPAPVKDYWETCRLSLPKQVEFLPSRKINRILALDKIDNQLAKIVLSMLEGSYPPDDAWNFAKGSAAQASERAIINRSNQLGRSP